MALFGIQCSYVTEECLKEWKTTNTARKLKGAVSAARFVFELCQTLVLGELPLTKCRVALDAVNLAEPASKDGTASLLADTIAHLGQELTVPGELRSRLVELAKWLVDSGLIPVRLLQERCEAEFLWEAEMIKIKAPDLKSKEVRVNTRLLYQQTKFNLLREESEGYAKLLTLLSQRGPDGLAHEKAPAVISAIKSLIGHFDLDPNRVFDIVLECYELQPDNSSFLELIPLFPKTHTTHILGFKFQFYQRPDVEDPAPDGLYRLAAALVKANCIELDSILAHMTPKDEEALQQYEEITKKRMEEANRIGKINLAAIGKDLMEEEKPGDVTIDLYSALDMESNSLLERSDELSSNQKLGLLTGFLHVNDWPHAQVLFERLAPLHPVAHEQISTGLIRAIENAIGPYYSYVRPRYLSKLGNGNVEVRPENAPELPKEVFRMLLCIGPYLHRNALLLQKVCRVLQGYYQAALSDVAYSTSMAIGQSNGQTEKRHPRELLKEARMHVEEVLGASLLPSLQLLPANPAVGLAIWDVMSLLPYEARYRLYGEWDKDDERIPMVLAARQTAKLDTRRILKRLAKENLKQLGRMVAKIAHANPMTVLRTIVHQIEAYKDMIAPVVDAFKYLTQLEYDVLEYVVIERLAQCGREKLKDDGINVSDWLQSLASFWGHLCKKYPSMELRGLVQYLVNQLKRGEGIELILLQELMQQMASVEYTENVTDDQLEALAGGEALRYQASAFGVTKNNKALMKSTNRLRDTLLSKDEPKLAVPLLILIAQQRSFVVVTAEASYIKVVSEQFDRCHGTLLQYVEFLLSAVTPLYAYAQLIPSLEDLVQKYHLEAEVAFHIYRPIMRLFKPHKSFALGWPADVTKPSTEGQGKDDSVTVTSELTLDLGLNQKSVKWSDLLEVIKTMLPNKAWMSLSPELYTTFWGLTHLDIYVPRKRYEAEILKQRIALKALEENSDNSHAAIAKRKKDKEKIQEVLDRLSSEYQKQEANAAAVHQRLVREKDGWLASCSESLKINMEFLQRCIFPRCVMSMMDAVYCARFVQTIHSLGTPFFNTINHIDALICKTLLPMICCCTEYEAGRLGRFLCETLKMAYHWKSSEQVYEKECGNMPGFATFYRDPNSARVTFEQYVRVHWKWNSRLTRLLIQCLESEEYMEIRNGLTVLTKIASVFPVMKKSGANLERRVLKIKGDEREDLKVLATGVAAALASRKNAWVPEEEFTMGFVELKPLTAKAGTQRASSPTASSAVSAEVVAISSKETGNSKPETVKSVNKTDSPGTLPATTKADSSSKGSLLSAKAPPFVPSASSNTGKSTVSYDGIPPANSSRSFAQSSTRSAADAQSRGVQANQAATVAKGEEATFNLSKTSNAADPEVGRSSARRPSMSASHTSMKDETASNRATAATSPGKPEREVRSEPGGSSRSRTSSAAVNASNGSAGGTASGSVKAQATVFSRGGERGNQDGGSRRTSDLKSDSSKVAEPDIKPGDREQKKPEANDTSTKGPASKSPVQREDTSATRLGSGEELVRIREKRFASQDDTERGQKRRKGPHGSSDNKAEAGELVRPSERERFVDQRMAERDSSRAHDIFEKGPQDRTLERPRDRSNLRGAERAVDRGERDSRPTERVPDRLDRDRGDNYTSDRHRDRSIEIFGRERSLDRNLDRVTDRVFERGSERIRDDRVKDERIRQRHSDLPGEQPHPDDRYPMQNLPQRLPPPPPYPPNTDGLNRIPVEEAPQGRPGRGVQIGLSPRPHEKLDKRRPDDSGGLEEPRKRRDDDARNRKRMDDREMQALKVDQDRERAKEKVDQMKDEDLGSGSGKRRRKWRDPSAANEMLSFAPAGPLMTGPASQYEGRDRERKGGLLPTRGAPHMDDTSYDKGPSSGRVHGKDGSKASRREHEQSIDRDWEEEKRPRAEVKSRRHHRK
ncbi:THO complex subunit 2 isoform X2 [Physcomitrium patens]|uniref:THO complex subunit 2 n=1 Tax=Physcomitrium patens TaxID=3218 RepID=A0A2K1JV35_PHYPA|nr:THO complex subunit 2-like isoform X2 [Physcomitrium patens]PNR45387.1 hypothetical protein PHYPA_015158 [Physcomitrium patens]|eukprot:XP_024388621.1 THO complex subunit 2-like isoform X2 [Physcomitrella patens]